MKFYIAVHILLTQVHELVNNSFSKKKKKKKVFNFSLKLLSLQLHHNPDVASKPIIIYLLSFYEASVDMTCVWLSTLF